MPKPTKKPVEPELVYLVVEARLFHSDPKVMKNWSQEDVSNPLTLETAKELLGWCTEDEIRTEIFASLPPEKQKGKSPKDLKIDNVYPILMLGGVPIYCKNNLENRPYRPQAAGDYSLEILRKKWKFNGETIIVDKMGMLHDGQHRLIGLALAVHEWKEDQKRPKDEQLWQKLWPEEPYIETMVILGIENDDATTNTIGVGIRRSLEDVLFRSPYFEDKPFHERKRLAKITSWASKLLWDRTDQKDSSTAPRRPHSESMDFIQRHERLLECVRFVYDEANDKFSLMTPLGYAAALMYLMATATSDSDEYAAVNSESVLKFDLWDKAEEFWVDFSANGKATEHLREALLNIPEGTGGAYSRDLRCGLIIKAWNLFSDGKKVTGPAIEVETSLNGIGQLVLAEHPRIGGIDVEYVPEVKKPKVEKVPTSLVKPNGKPVKEGKAEVANKPVAAGECPQGGNHDYIKDDGDEFCAKCFEPKVTVKKKVGKK